VGKVAIANAKLAYQERSSGSALRRCAPERADAARVVGQHRDQEPALQRRPHIEELIGKETVNTVPPETLNAFRDHGQPARSADSVRHRPRSTI
jgi:transaldolase/glucose-6-phosphate isomerase